jgi:hypothetical protein
MGDGAGNIWGDWWGIDYWCSQPIFWSGNYSLLILTRARRIEMDLELNSETTNYKSDSFSFLPRSKFQTLFLSSKFKANLSVVSKSIYKSQRSPNDLTQFILRPYSIGWTHFPGHKYCTYFCCSKSSWTCSRRLCKERVTAAGTTEHLSIHSHIRHWKWSGLCNVGNL